MLTSLSEAIPFFPGDGVEAEPQEKAALWNSANFGGQGGLVAPPPSPAISDRWGKPAAPVPPRTLHTPGARAPPREQLRGLYLWRGGVAGALGPEGPQGTAVAHAVRGQGCCRDPSCRSSAVRAAQDAGASPGATSKQSWRRRLLSALASGQSRPGDPRHRQLSLRRQGTEPALKGAEGILSP